MLLSISCEAQNDSDPNQRHLNDSDVRCLDALCCLSPKEMYVCLENEKISL